MLLWRIYVNSGLGSVNNINLNSVLLSMICMIGDSRIEEFKYHVLSDYGGKKYDEIK